MDSVHAVRAPTEAPRRWRGAVLATAVLLLAACASSPHRHERTFKPSDSALANEPARAPTGEVATANDVLFRALALVGTPYHWGGNTPAGGFDCSGLVGYVFRTIGIDLPRVSRSMAHEGTEVANRDALAEGDLVFFGKRGRIDHVGIYIGDGKFLHAPRTGRDVTVSSLTTGYWSQKYLQARRIANGT